MKKFAMLAAGVACTMPDASQLARADDAESIKNAEFGGSRGRRRRCRDPCSASRRYHQSLA